MKPRKNTILILLLGLLLVAFTAVAAQTPAQGEQKKPNPNGTGRQRGPFIEGQGGDPVLPALRRDRVTTADFFAHEIEIEPEVGIARRQLLRLTISSNGSTALPGFVPRIAEIEINGR